MTGRSYYKTFSEKLSGLRNLELTVLISTNLLRFILFLGCLFLVFSIIESIFWLPTGYRISLFTFLLLSGAVLLIYCGKDPFKAVLKKDPRLSFESLAKKIGNTYPEIKDKLLNAMQVFSQMSSDNKFYSPVLITETMNKIGESFISYDFNKSTNLQSLKKHSAYFLLFSVLSISLLFTSSDSLNSAVSRIFQPTRHFNPPAAFSFFVDPGNVEIIRGGPLNINVDVSGEVPENLFLFIQRKSSAVFDEFLLEKNESGNFTFVHESVKESFIYFVRGRENRGILPGRDIDSDVFSVNVILRPMVRKLKIHLDYPEYSGMEDRYLEDNIGDITALKGTKVRLEVNLNKSVEEASVGFSTGEIISFQTNNMRAETNFTLISDLSYRISLKDDEGIENIDPIEYKVSVIEDSYPFIQFILPGGNTDLTEDRNVLLGMKLSDDFGLSRLKFGYKIIDKLQIDQIPENEEQKNIMQQTAEFNFRDLILENKYGAVQDFFFFWDLSKLQLFPEDRILYYAELYDNDRISGPKKTSSELYTLRLPSIEELFNYAEEKQQQQEDLLEDVLEESKKLKENLQEIANEFLRADKLEWEQQKKAEDAIQKQEDIQERMEDIKKEIEDLIRKFEDNDLLSAEILDKYSELQELLKEVYSPEIKSALEQFKKSMDTSGNMTQNRRDLENFRQEQDDYLEQIDRSLQLFKKLQLEQIMDEIVTKSENITETQKTINKELDSLNTKKTGDPLEKEFEKEKLVRKENDLSGSMENLEDTIKKLIEKMLEFPEISTEDLNQAKEKVEAGNLPEKMKQMSREIFMDELKRSIDSGKVLEQLLEEIEQELKESKENLSQEQKQNILDDILKAAYDLLKLSEKQELLKNESQSLTINSDKFTSIADEQSFILSGMMKVMSDFVKITEETFLIPAELAASLGATTNSMSNSIKMLEERNKAGTIQHQDVSLKGINESAGLLLMALQNVQQSGSGMGYEEFMEQMEELSEQQEQLNQDTQDIKGDPNSAGQQSLMDRLAQQQEMIRRALEDLKNEMQNRQSLEERLSQMGQEMEDVVKDMKENQITDRTLDLQERILTRMLDTQRSIHRRDFSRKRISERPELYETLDPGSLPADLGESIKFLEEEFIKALKEGYSRDFEKIIRKYFENLNKKNSSKVIKKN
ncbi:DUF4175 family protein [candidate division KSB1 bacterium]